MYPEPFYQPAYFTAIKAKQFLHIFISEPIDIKFTTDDGC